MLARATKSKKEIGENYTFFRDNKASFWKNNSIHYFVFWNFV